MEAKDIFLSTKKYCERNKVPFRILEQIDLKDDHWEVILSGYEVFEVGLDGTVLSHKEFVG